MLRFDVITPDPAEFTETPAGRRRRGSQVDAVCDQELRRRWRALVLIVKAKLECIESGLSTVEEEFLANVVLPDGTTVGAATRPILDKAYTSGSMPRRLLPGV